MPNDQLKTLSTIFFIRYFCVSVKNLFCRGLHSSHNFCWFFYSVFLEFFSGVCGKSVLPLTTSNNCEKPGAAAAATAAAG